MTQQLPTRPFTPLPPPADGIAQAVRTGRRIRLRRRLTVTGASLAVVGAVAAAALFGPASTGASDQLVPADAPSATPVSQPARVAHETGHTPGPSVPTAPAVVGAGGARLGGGSVAAGTHASQRAAGHARSGAAGQAAAEQPTSYRTPDLIRTYRPPSSGGVSPSHGPNPSLCSGAVGAGRSGVQTTNNWCMTAAVTRTTRGHDLSLVVCRDSTTSAQLHYTRSREADLQVLSGDKPVWQWSAGHEDTADQHVLAVDADGCWTWTAPWTDVDGRGQGLKPGDYTLAVSSPASELSAYDDRQVTFSIS